MWKCTPGWRERARVSAAGPSFLRCPAASSTSGTETTSRLPCATSSSIPVSTSGSASSMNPNPTGNSPAASRTWPASVQNSSSPSASRVPWPTTMRDGDAACAWAAASEGGVAGARHASHPRAATSTAIASAGTIAAPTHATGDAAGASCSDGIRPS